MNVKETLLNTGHEGVVYLSYFSFDTAFIGVSKDNRAMYNYDRMVEWLVFNEEMSWEEAEEWLDYNGLRVTDEGPVIIVKGEAYE